MTKEETLVNLVQLRIFYEAIEILVAQGKLSARDLDAAIDSVDLVKIGLNVSLDGDIERACAILSAGCRASDAN